jgi:hypothetical protein
MKQLIFSINDLKAELWTKPMFVLKEGQMLRTFSDSANDPSNYVGQHPEDYCLYLIGEWDEEKGELKYYDAKKSYGLASGYVKQIKGE